LDTGRKFDLIVATINRGFAEQVVDAARSAGAHGGTVFYARGAGSHDVEKFLTISIQPEKEVVMILVQHDQTQAVIHAIVSAAGLKTEGRGIVVALPINSVAGIVHAFTDMKAAETNG